MSEYQNFSENPALLDLTALSRGRETKVSFKRTFPLDYTLGDVRAEKEVVCVGTVSDYSGVLQFQAEFLFSYVTCCDRCLKPIARTLSVSVDRPVSKDSAGEESECVVAENDVIDLAALCVEGIDEHLPFKHLCSEHCRGLCPYCGTDLNEAACTCKAPPDPRLAGLAEFFHE